MPNSDLAGVIGAPELGAPAPPAAAAPASAAQSFVTIKTPKGVAFQVDPKYAPNFQGFVNDLEGSGYSIRSVGGVSNRNVAGTNTPSEHTSGHAIDINSDTNPVGSRGDLPADVGDLARKYGLGWGGAWHSKSDPMHFSIAPHEGGSGTTLNGGAGGDLNALLGFSGDNSGVQLASGQKDPAIGGVTKEAYSTGAIGSTPLPPVTRPRHDLHIPGDQLGPEFTDEEIQAGNQATLSKPIVDTGALGAADALVRKAANTATGGWADKIAAGASALGKSDNVDALAGNFSNELTRQRAMDSQAGIYHPASTMTGGVLGSVGQAVLLPEVKAAGLGGRVVGGALQGAGIGALDASGNARGNAGDVLKATVPGAIGGAITGGALSGLFGPGVPKAPSDPLAAYTAAGVDPMLAISGGENAQRAGGILKGLPIIGTPLSQAAVRTSGQLDAGVLSQAMAYGKSTNALQAGSALQTGAQTARDDLTAGVGNAYAPISHLESSVATSPASNTMQAIADLKARYPNTPEWFRSNTPTLARLDDTLGNNGGNLTYGELKNIRTDVGSLAAGSFGNDVNTVDQAALNRVYGAMSKDMENGIYSTAYQQAWKATKNPTLARQAGLDAQTQLTAANAANQQMRDTVTNTLLPIMNAKTPEAAFGKMVSAAQAGAGSADVEGLLRAKAALPPQAWNEVSAGLLSTMGREGGDASGAFSPAKFTTALSKMTPEGRSALFGSGPLADNVAALESVAKDQAKAAKFYNNSNSGNMLATLGGGGAITQAMVAAAHGDLRPAVVTAMTGLSGITASKLLASPGFARFMLKAKMGGPSGLDKLFSDFATQNPGIAPAINEVRSRLPTALNSMAIGGESNGSQPTPARTGALTTQ